MKAMIEVRNINKQFYMDKTYVDLLLHPLRKHSITALKNVSFKVEKGQIMGLLGPNGAGKTTLLKIFCGLLLPTDGEIYIDGEDIVNHPGKARNLVGYVVSEERSFYWRLTGRQNLMFFANLNNLFGDTAKRTVQEDLERVGLIEETEKVVKNYSSGMRQKLAIARCLLCDPQILLFDEPTKSLDPSAAEALRGFIRKKLVDVEGKTVVIATHNIDEAMMLCDNLSIINRGEIKYKGTVAGFYKMASVPYKYSLKVAPPYEGLADSLKRLPTVSQVTLRASEEPREECIFEVTLSRDEIGEVISFIVAQGAKILSCIPIKASLSDVYTRIVGEGRNDDLVEKTLGVRSVRL